MTESGKKTAFGYQDGDINCSWVWSASWKGQLGVSYGEDTTVKIQKPGTEANIIFNGESLL